jgi:hypothetical protein
MTHSDPSSSHDPNRISPIDSEADALWEPLPLGKEDAPSDDSSFVKDEERLYTDAIIRENENASRFLFFSFMLAGLISLILGLWYVVARQQSQTEPNAPLEVPTTPPLPPDLNITPPPLPNNTPIPTGTPFLPGRIPTSSPLETPASSPGNNSRTTMPGSPRNNAGQPTAPLPPPPPPTP